MTTFSYTHKIIDTFGASSCYYDNYKGWGGMRGMRKEKVNYQLKLSG